jgi:hypothetical protein
MQDAAKQIRDIMDRFDQGITELRRIHRERILAIVKKIEEGRLRKIEQEIAA